MNKIKLAAIFSVLLVSACASSYGNITPLGESRYQIVSTGETKAQATSMALSGAEAKCKNFVVTGKSEKYTGVFANEQVHMQSKALRDAVINGTQAVSMFSPKRGAIANVTSESSEGYFDEAFETTLEFVCR